MTLEDLLRRVLRQSYYGGGPMEARCSECDCIKGEGHREGRLVGDIEQALADEGCPQAGTEHVCLEAPAPYSIWRQRNGNLYEVIAIANTDSTRPDYKPTVVYRGVANGKIWARLLSDWRRSFALVEENMR